jgi:hypothetical protein
MYQHRLNALAAAQTAESLTEEQTQRSPYLREFKVNVMQVPLAFTG